MNEENNTSPASDATTGQKQTLQERKRDKSKFVKLVSNNKLVTFLIVVIIVLLGWALFKMYVMGKDYAKATNQIKTEYVNKIEQINSSYTEQISKVFAWAIRSEKMRGNDENVNQFFMDYIREPNVLRVMLVNPETAMIELSTDKNDEGKTYTGSNLQTNSTLSSIQNDVLQVVTPVMGLNSKIGVLVIDYRKE